MYQQTYMQQQKQQPTTEAATTVQQQQYKQQQQTIGRYSNPATETLTQQQLTTTATETLDNSS